MLLVLNVRNLEEHKGGDQCLQKNKHDCETGTMIPKPAMQNKMLRIRTSIDHRTIYRIRNRILILNLALNYRLFI